MDDDRYPNNNTNINPNKSDPNTQPVSGEINPTAPVAPGRKPAYSDGRGVREDREKYGI